MLVPASTHQRLIIKCYLATRIFYALLFTLLSALPLFDTSPLVVIPARSLSWSSTLLRWDAFHFASIAQVGYIYEYQFAFQPGMPLVMRWLGSGINFLGGDGKPMSISQMLVGGTVGSFFAGFSALDLYRLTVTHTSSPQFALLTTLLSLLPSSPATTFHAPYNEPIFAFFSFKGMLMCTRRRWFSASVCFALATLFRVNGVLLAGFIVWGMVVEPLIRRHQLPSVPTSIGAFLLSALPATPFIAHQYYAFALFCHPTPTREWCTRSLPFIYSFVQRRYWNVGFLRYWTLGQVPNFLMAAPVLLLLLFTSVSHTSRTLNSLHQPTGPPVINTDELSMLPHAIHALALTLILIFASHTQIALRLASSLPYLYWSAAWLFTRHGNKPYPRWWVTWSTLWGTISTVLWATFLPPA